MQLVDTVHLLVDTVHLLVDTVHLFSKKENKLLCTMYAYCVVFINIWRNYVNREQGHIKLKKLLLLLWKKVDDESHFS